MIKDQKINEVYKETENFGRMQFVDRIATLELREEKLIKFLEDKIKRLREKGASYGLTIDYDIAEYIDTKIEAYKDILERMRSGKYD